MNADTNQVLAVLARLAAANQRGAWDYASIVATVLMLFVLIWYAFETYRLRVAAVRQAASATTPIVAIAPVLNELGHADIAIRNVGSGPAFNLSVEATTDKGGAQLAFQFCDVLAGQETQKLTVMLQQPGRPDQMLRHHEISEAIEQGQLPSAIPVTITYNAASGKQYRTTMSFEQTEGLLFYRFCTHRETKQTQQTGYV